jgi:alkylated DNA repair dioxygenase AlkB
MNIFGSGDSYLIKNILPEALANEYFYLLRDEIEWEKVEHKGGQLPREITSQVEYYCYLHNRDNCMNATCMKFEPVYRHPIDYELKIHEFSTFVKCIRDHILQMLSEYDENVRFNHVLMQFYRSGLDYIGDHCDKTLDIKRNSFIVNYSLGATRIMTLRSKKSMDDESSTRTIQKIELEHNSLFILGSETNKLYTHGIRPDKRSENDKSEDSKIYEGQRISLTFRNIATYRQLDNGRLFGQGAINKQFSSSIKEEQKDNGENDVNNLLQAFSAENRSPDFDWDRYYSQGFDVTCINGST